MFCLQSHYRKPLTFTFESLDNAAVAYNKLTSRIANLKAEGEIETEKAEQYKAKFREGMGNDLNTSLGLTCLYDVLKADINDATKLHLIEDFDSVLSIGLISAAEKIRASKDESVNSDFASEIEELIAKRQKARAEKDWATADRIRDELAARKIVIKDTPQGVKWEIEA